MTEITKNQFYQLLGLCINYAQLQQKEKMLADSWSEIVGEGNRDRFWDFSDVSDCTEENLKKKLEYDKITIKGEKND